MKQTINVYRATDDLTGAVTESTDEALVDAANVTVTLVVEAKDADIEETVMLGVRPETLTALLTVLRDGDWTELDKLRQSSVQTVEPAKPKRKARSQAGTQAPASHSSAAKLDPPVRPGEYKAVRLWAPDAGYTVKEKGRVDAAIVQAFREAQPAWRPAQAA